METGVRRLEYLKHRALVCYTNHQFIPLEQAGIPVTDLGVQRGYGIFDFLRVTENIPLFIDDHLDRFYHSAKVMRLTIPFDKAGLRSLIEDLIRKNDQPDSGIRILLTGGNSKDGYQILEPVLTLIQQPLTKPGDAIISSGIKLVTYSHQRQMPQVKTTDYLMAIWLNPWVKEQGADDVLYHQNGILSECPRSNFFLIDKNGVICTPRNNILPGITRKNLLRIAKAYQLPMEEKDISLNDLKEAKEAFITSSTKRLIPVRQIDDIIFPAFDPKGITANLYSLFLQKEKELLRG
jgi:D-alanine transaminase/branched-chain amino acid aminotransferase